MLVGAKRSSRVVALTFCSIGLAGPLSASADHPSPTEPAPRTAFSLTGITAPHRQATLAALNPGRIERLPFDEGERVRAGEVVVRLDDRVQRVRTEIYRRESESTLGVELARARLERAEQELERLSRLSGELYASSKELDDALAEAKVRRVEYQIALFEREQATQQYQREKLVLDELQIRAPYNGYVAEHLLHAGEVVDERDGIVRLVQLDPLEVWVDCPLSVSGEVREGDRVLVRPAQDNRCSRSGRVLLVNRVADAGSQTVKIKLVVDNNDGRWISGLKVTVDFGLTSDRTSGDSKNAGHSTGRAESAQPDGN